MRLIFLIVMGSVFAAAPYQTNAQDEMIAELKTDEDIANIFFEGLANKDVGAVNANISSEAVFTQFEFGAVQSDSPRIFGANLFGKVLARAYHEISLTEELTEKHLYKYGGTFTFSSGDYPINVELEIEDGKIVRIHRYWIGNAPPPIRVMPAPPSSSGQN